MKTFLKKHLPDLPVALIYIVFFSSLFFSFRAITSISIGALLIAGIIKHHGRIRLHKANLLLTSCAVFFLLQFVPLLYTDNMPEEWNNIRLKSGLVIIPLAVILTGPFDKSMRKILLPSYCLLLLAALLYCFVITLLHYQATGDTSVFFYHRLVSPLHQHAVYLSIFIFIGLVFLLENMQKKYFITRNIFSLLFILIFSGFLFLLSSKLVISCYVLYLIYYFLSLTKHNVLHRRVIIGLIVLLAISLVLIFSTRNPISDRFRDITTGDPALFEKDRYTPGDYFNGIQFRLLQWRLVPEILDQHRSWWLGIGAANAQPFLNREYARKNMYLGDSLKGDIGYQAYNTHNQFLEALLKNGVLGLISFIFICFTLIKIAWQRKQRATGFIIGLLLAYSLIESILETQYGIVLFIFFPAFLCQED